MVLMMQGGGRALNLAWCGDCRAVLASYDRDRGVPLSARPLTEDHKPERPSERRRIEAAGGCVRWDGRVYRVNGNLAVARALGDYRDRHLVIARPDVISIELDARDARLRWAPVKAPRAPHTSAGSARAGHASARPGSQPRGGARHAQPGATNESAREQSARLIQRHNHRL